MNNGNDISVYSVSEEQLSLIIGSQFKELTKLEHNVQTAVNKAEQAQQKASDAQVPAGWFQKKDAIELLQDAVKGVAEAQITAVEAQKILFEYQTELAKRTKYLFYLGLSNIAMNRSVVRELELRLKRASEEELSNLAKQELQNVIKQLKVQEDMMKKQEDLSRQVKEYKDVIAELNSKIERLQHTTSKVGWKIGISIIAVSSFIINILYMLEII